MRIFMTGATGYVGAAAAAAARARGHEVTALVRSTRSAAAATAAGLLPILGSLREPDRYVDRATEADVIGFIENEASPGE